MIASRISVPPTAGDRRHHGRAIAAFSCAMTSIGIM
jgi:hypothetical protein